MNSLASRITAELNLLIGQPLFDFWRCCDMAIFEFGSPKSIVNKKGEQVQTAPIKLHLQCPWRVTDAQAILFAADDVFQPADPAVSLADFDASNQKSVLDLKAREWITSHAGNPLKVRSVEGDEYGGFRIRLQAGFTLECFRSTSFTEEAMESWRLFGHRGEDFHFVV